MIMFNELKAREEAGNIIRIALVGAGQMGQGLVSQCELINGMQVVAIYSRSAANCHKSFRLAGVAAADIIATDDPIKAEQAIDKKQRVVANSTELLCQIKNVDIIVEATGIPNMGALVALQAIRNKKHIVQMNVEADATVGYILSKKAEEAGLVYTLSGGDEPGACMELYDFATTLGFDVICAGKGKNNRVNIHAKTTDEAVIAKAAKFNMSREMLVSFVDGSKTMLEMTSLGNALGFRANKTGMSAVECTPSNIAAVFCPKAAGGILNNDYVVDYGYGIAPGVFVVIRLDKNPKALLDFQYLALGTGPYYALYRPYHLVSLETPITIYKAVVHGQQLLASSKAPVNEAVGYAKENLASGSLLSGDTSYAVIHHHEQAAQQAYLPAGLLGSLRLRKNLSQDQIIRYADVELDESQAIVQLRREQDLLLAK